MKGKIDGTSRREKPFKLLSRNVVRASYDLVNSYSHKYNSTNVVQDTETHIVFFDRFNQHAPHLRILHAQLRKNVFSIALSTLLWCLAQVPDTYDGDEADSDEDYVHAEQQPVEYFADHSPFIHGFAPLIVFLYVEADGREVSAQFPQLIQGRLRRRHRGFR